MEDQWKIHESWSNESGGTRDKLKDIAAAMDCGGGTPWLFRGVSEQVRQANLAPFIPAPKGPFWAPKGPF